MVASRRTFLAASAAAALARGESGARISLAAWSLSGSFFQGKWKLLELPGILRNKLGIQGLEHVNQFFENPTLTYLQKLRRATADNGITAYLLMVDNEGATAALDPAERKQAEIAHRKWIDIAHYLGCRYVRCNLYGGQENWKQDPDIPKRGAETFRNLLDYAKGSGLQLLVENHGRASSDPDNLVSLVKLVDSPDFGLLVDLGNWNPGDDRYENVRKTIPYGRALSVKGTWGANLDPAFDMEKLMRVARDGGYKAWWAIEVTPRRNSGPPETLHEREIATVLEVKEIIRRTV